jgi:hypothetical protein
MRGKTNFASRSRIHFKKFGTATSEQVMEVRFRAPKFFRLFGRQFAREVSRRLVSCWDCANFKIRRFVELLGNENESRKEDKGGRGKEEGSKRRKREEGEEGRRQEKERGKKRR